MGSSFKRNLREKLSALLKIFISKNISLQLPSFQKQITTAFILLQLMAIV
jgi:hypothetical protein